MSTLSQCLVPPPPGFPCAPTWGQGGHPWRTALGLHSCLGTGWCLEPPTRHGWAGRMHTGLSWGSGPSVLGQRRRAWGRC